MRNLSLVVKILGHLLFYEVIMMLVCLGISLYFGEDDVLAFAVSVVVTIAAAITLCLISRNAQNTLSRRDSYLVVTASWIVFSLFGTLPYIIGGYIPDFSDAFFEAISNFTTTGLSTFNVDMPHGMIVWRSLTQWVGGLGIVFFTIAILPSFADGEIKVFAAEATGPTKSKLHPRLKTNTRWIWFVYLSLTIACTLCYWLAGMDTFESINYSMITNATGGHAPYADSIAHFNSAAIDYVAIVFMFLAGINFSLLYSILFKFDFKRMLQNSELKFYFMIVCLITTIIAITLFVSNGYSIPDAIRESLFEVVSIITTTGFYSDNITYWTTGAWFLLVFCMVMGACAGSTSGGIKAMRVVILIKNLRNEFRRILHPNAVLSVRVNDGVVHNSTQATLAAFITIYFIIIIISSLFFVSLGMDMESAYTATLSCISNCGPAFGPAIDASIGWDVLSPVAKWYCSALMLIGRLEVFSVLIIFTKSFWRDN